MDKQFEDWLKTRPAIIQKLARAYPPGDYKMAPDAPYGYTCGDSIVTLVAYNENGNVRVSLKPENVLAPAIEHAKSIRPDFEVPLQPIDAYVDPQYLIPLNS